MRKVVIFLLFAVIFWGGYFYFHNRDGLSRVIMDSRTYYVEVASTPEARERGLMNRDTIGRADGMIFVFDDSGIYPFWMKNTRFSLDIIWINNGRVVYIAESAKSLPEPPYPTYAPTEVANFVLELPGGTALRNGIHIGSEAEIVL